MSDVPIRTIIVDDDPRVISAMQMLINGQPDMHCVAQAGDGAAAVRVARDIPCDVMLMDVRMPNMDGIAATREIVKARNGDLPRVLVMTTFEHDNYVYEALAAGASGFVLKRSQTETLFEAIRVAARGESLVLPVMTRTVVQRFAPEYARANDPRMKLLATLTEREAEMLRHIALGLTNAEIADVMAVSINTVKTHVANVLGKLALRDRTQAVILAYETEFIQRPS